MAGLDLSVHLEAYALSVDNWKTALSFKAPTNQMLRVKGLKFATDGTAGDAKSIEFRFTKITNDSGTGTAITPEPLNGAMTATPQGTYRKAFSAEPSESGTNPYLYPDRFHPQAGIVRNDDFREILIKENTERALQFKIPSGGSVVNLTGHVIVEE